MYLLSTWWRRCVEKRGGGGGREREILSIARGKRVFTPVVDELNLINYIAKRAASKARIVSWGQNYLSSTERARVQLHGTVDVEREEPNETSLYSVIIVLF